jgi:hypothetical protein
MEKSASALCKEIRDSAEQATNVTKRLEAIKIDSEWSLILGWSTFDEEPTTRAVMRQWKSTLRELGGQFIELRDRRFATTVQVDISTDSLKRVSEAVDRATTALQVALNQVSGREIQPFRANEINQISIKLRRQSDRIHKALRYLDHEVQDHSGTRPVSRSE